MARVEREQHRVVDRGSLDFEIERLAKAVARDSEHPPRQRAERENVAAGGFLGEVLFDVANLAPLRFDYDVEVAVLGNRAARGDRGQTRAAPRAHALADTIVKDLWRRAL